MRISTKIKAILQNNTIGISFGTDGWSITVISFSGPAHRKNFNAGSYGEVINQAYKNEVKTHRK